MKNMFENAKFGDKFVTRDNKIAKFICNTEIPSGVEFCLYIDGQKVPMWYDEKGICLLHNIDFDIVSKYNK